MFNCILRVLCRFWISVLDQICDLQIFSPTSVHSLKGSFEEWKLTVFMNSGLLSVFSSTDGALGMVPTDSAPQLRSQVFPFTFIFFSKLVRFHF